MLFFRSRVACQGPGMRVTGGVSLILLVLAGADAACDWQPQHREDLEARCVCGTGGNLRLTVQCSSVDLLKLTEALRSKPPLDLLSLMNGSVPVLGEGSFEGLDMRSLQLQGVGLRDLREGAFRERGLSSLSLEGNELSSVPALRTLKELKELDLSRNRISSLPDAAFEGLALTTLKLADNPLLQISDGAFLGLEPSLHNLNLKGCGLERVPASLRALTQLSFLDLSQNGLEGRLGEGLSGLRRLTALTLERNALREVGAGELPHDALSSLSLLNNKIEAFPTQALRPLAQLRVLDVGFNRLRGVPEDAFSGNPLLTLLALDGNPLDTLPLQPFQHLNATLRGLSIGGSTLVCDCRLRWILEWVKKYDLQVSSRERNPQFCGRPAHFRRRPLPNMTPLELRCDDTTTTAGPPTTTKSSRDLRAPRTSPLDALHVTEAVRVREGELRVRWEGAREDNLVRARSAAPLHLMYRVFAETHFHVGQTINPSAGWAQFQVPEGKALVVCVVDTAQANTLTVHAVPRNQCREVPSDHVTENQLNKIIIGSSAAICGLILVAIVIFVCCSRKTPPPVMLPPPRGRHSSRSTSGRRPRSTPGEASRGPGHTTGVAKSTPATCSLTTCSPSGLCPRPGCSSTGGRSPSRSSRDTTPSWGREGGTSGRTPTRTDPPPATARTTSARRSVFGTTYFG